MEVTSVVIDKYIPKSYGTCAEASIVLDDMLVIHRLCVVKGNKGYFVAMPHSGATIVGDKRKYMDLVYPITAEMKSLIEEAVLKAYFNYDSK